MFDSKSEEKARQIAEWFADYESFQSHGRRVGPDQAVEVGVNVIPLEKDEKLQDAVLSAHHATMHTFSGTRASKIVENHHGRAWVMMSGEVMLQVAGPPGGPPPGGGPAVPPTPGRGELSRAERRRQKFGRR